ncbi:MAG: hypothetical protein Q8906_07505 [Bacillota bacterium]|nr:hypothetical protein [Bacillota bacterium]MDP4170442.1 hypothetical protein [Bacillota bacterium]
MIVRTAAFLFFLLIPLGCSITSRAEEKPPEAKIEVQNKMYPTVLGSYCWSGKGTGKCVDTIGPVQMLAGKEAIKVKPNEVITFIMNYKPKPNQFHVQSINANKETKIVKVKNNLFTAPKQKGTYYYSFGVWWMDKKIANQSRGSADYDFVLQVK